jgi:hypothetical protein
MSEITRSVSVYQTIRDRILAIEGTVDEATLADTIEGLTELNDVVAAVVRMALLEEAMAEGLKAHIELLQDRLERLWERAASRRQVARDAMIEVDLKKVASPDFTITIRPGAPAVVIVDEKSVPQTYWQAREPRLDRIQLLSDLKLGLPVAGAHLSNPEPVLSVRIR